MNFKKLKIPAEFADSNILLSVITVAREIVVSCGSAASTCGLLVLSKMERCNAHKIKGNVDVNKYIFG